MSAARRRPAQGLPIDADGNLTIDPTKNVLDLVEAAVKRIDDMADLRARLADAQITRLEAMATLRADHNKELREVSAEHNASLRRAESARLDSIRAVDREDVSKTAAQVLNAVQTLATTANTTAETLRNQRTADAADFSKRLGAVELALSEGKGKQQVADPQMERLTALVEVMARGQDKGAGKSEGASDTVKMIALAISMFVGLIGIGTFVFVTQREAPAPQIIYAPAPTPQTGVVPVQP